MGHTVIGLAADSESLKLKASAQSEDIGVEFSKIFVLIKKGNNDAKVVSLKVDCFGLVEASQNIDWKTNKKPLFWDKSFNY